jgi:hypothetical protein
VFDTRVERPPHYDTFAEFHYAYHYGDVYIPYIKQEEPLKIECQHFLDCIRNGTTPLSSGKRGMDLVQILEASSESLKRGGGPVDLPLFVNGAVRPRAAVHQNGDLAVKVMVEAAPKAAPAAPLRKRTRSRQAVQQVEA